MAMASPVCPPFFTTPPHLDLSHSPLPPIPPFNDPLFPPILFVSVFVLGVVYTLRRLFPPKTEKERESTDFVVVVPPFVLPLPP